MNALAAAKAKLPELDRQVRATLMALRDLHLACDDPKLVPLMKPTFQLLREWEKFTRYVETHAPQDAPRLRVVR